jgi:hypothetical protein
LTISKILRTFVILLAIEVYLLETEEIPQTRKKNEKLIFKLSPSVMFAVSEQDGLCLLIRFLKPRYTSPFYQGWAFFI